ncbi:hypothetical protein BDZ97DRAFT_1120879 [Flammula alnicola]|nr:hypothetical protein BDZ97DRAFT_1120879 [Flammula alnicola]
MHFGLKIAWFVLSITGLAACWIVLWAFARAVGTKWGPVLYCIGNTLLQGIFCLGMIYRMDPFEMPRSFCIVQTVVISFAGYFSAGVAMAFSLATSLTVLKPKTWGDGVRALKWRNIYAAPIIAFPLIATIIHIIFILKFDSVKPSDDMHCDSTDPEWVRFLGYAGVPFVMAWPSLYLSVKSILRVHKTNQHLQRACPESVDEFTSVPRKSRKREISFATRMGLSSPQPVHPRREPIAPAITSPALLAKKFHLPFKAPKAASTDHDTQESSNFSALDLQDDTSSRVSVSFPTFAHPETTGTPVEEERERTIRLSVVDKQEEQKSAEWDDELVKEPRGSDSNEDTGWNEDKLDLQSVSDIGKDEYVMSDAKPHSPRPTSMAPSAAYRKTRRPIPNLAPAVWRIVLFQVVFTSVQFLACISTIIDVIARRPKPTPLGTQHFALLLAAWGPVIIFGHLPAVRRNLIPWRAIS